MSFQYTCARASCADWSTTDREEAIEHGALGLLPRHIITARTVTA